MECVMICPKCNEKVASDAKICPKCGAEMEKIYKKRGFFIYDNCTKEEIKDNQPFSIILI